MKLVEFVPPTPHPLWELCPQMGITDVIVKVNPDLTGLPDPWRYETLSSIVSRLESAGLNVVGLEGDPFDMSPIKEFGAAVELSRAEAQSRREEALAHYRELGLDVPVRGDHVPEMAYDRVLTPEGTPGYFTLGRLFANGYLKALLQGTGLVLSRPRRTARTWSVLACLLCAVNVFVACAAGLEIGWAERDVTPSLDCGKKIPLAGQYYVRDATNIHSRLKFTCCVMRNGDEQALMGSVDVVSLWDPFTKRLSARLHERVPEIRPESVFLGCPHNHAAPYLRPCYTPAAKEWEAKNPGRLTPDEYADFVLERALDAFEEAWRGAAPGGVARAFGTARIGHCRIATYLDGTSEMYGNTNRPDFAGMLEGEDDCVEMLFTCDATGRKTGVFVNAACPSQVMELSNVISSDFAGAMREKLAKRHGGKFHSIYHLGAAGCQSPRDLVAGRERDGYSGWDEASVEAISDRLVRCVTEAEVHTIPCPPVLRHSVRPMRLPMRRVSAAETEAARRELAAYEAKWPGKTAWEDFLREIHHYEQTQGRFPYDSKLHPYAAMDVCRAVIKRAETQDANPFLDIESHIVRIGDVAFVTNPFELYLAYGQVVKARSAAKQTFLIGKCGSCGYVPTERSEKAVGYSGGVNVGRIGHQGGYMFCDEVVKGVAELFPEPAANH